MASPYWNELIATAYNPPLEYAVLIRPQAWEATISSFGWAEKVTCAEGCCIVHNFWLLSPPPLAQSFVLLLFFSALCYYKLLPKCFVVVTYHAKTLSLAVMAIGLFIVSLLIIFIYILRGTVYLKKMIINKSVLICSTYHLQISHFIQVTSELSRRVFIRTDTCRSYFIFIFCYSWYFIHLIK